MIYLKKIKENRIQDDNQEEQVSDHDDDKGQSDDDGMKVNRC